VETRNYTQRRRADDAAARTERIMQATLELYLERPFEQITLAAVAERAGVGLQTLIRRVGTKDGLVRAVGDWVRPLAAAGLGDPAAVHGDPRAVADAFRRHYDRWGALIARDLAQEESSPVIRDSAEAGRAGHRAWLSAAFATALDARPGAEADELHARLVGVTGIELWRVLTHHEGRSSDQARDTVVLLLTACLNHHPEPPTTTPTTQENPR
jgi:AcrR family transcriptional regulator